MSPCRTATPADTMDSDDPRALTRRAWLQRGLGHTLGAGALMQALGAARPAHAADYKALVCVFLYGGNDGMNMVVPTDSTQHARYAAVRRDLAIPLGQLRRLEGSHWGLHPAMAALLPAWNAGQLAPVLNVGPLAAPLSKAQYRATPGGSSRVPFNLFSHSHQQTLWEAGNTDIQSRSGWGGRAARLLSPEHPVIAIGRGGRFSLGTNDPALVLPRSSTSFGTVELFDEGWRRTWTPAVVRARALRQIYAQDQSHPLAAAYVRAQRDAFELSERLGPVVARRQNDAALAAGLRSAFGPISSGGTVSTDLGAQLFQIAKLIEQRALVGGARQIFFASLGGFDTHAGQSSGGVTQGRHAQLLRQLADALAAFHNAMQNIGLGGSVTSFTQSDFGRTFAPNNSNGTDHGWGNHQLVLGGAVRGRRSYGRAPELVLGGPDDVGEASWERQGRWIPSVSVDQYAATLLSWFGAGSAQLDAVLPNLGNFGGSRTLGFV